MAFRSLPGLFAALVCTACGDAGGDPAPMAGSFKLLSEPAAVKASGPPPPDPSLWEMPETDLELEAGRQVWVGTCIACHSTGLGGAPLIGNESLWAPRLAQGLDVLVEHATRGFAGKVGEMPARGGNASLSDADVRAAVRFMASRAGGA